MESYVKKVKIEIADKLLAGLESQGFTISHPPYTVFSGKKKGISCTLYISGKLLVQGSKMREFIEFFLEPTILENFDYTHIEAGLDYGARIGIDESGKGDFFGPLCIAGVFAEGSGISHLKTLGVRDSKTFRDEAALQLARKIRADFPVQVIKIGPAKYNEMYPQFANLNALLGWGHATAIEGLVAETSCRRVLIDQFANERIVIGALARKKIDIELTQRHRAEEDLVVAAASIVARAAFLEGLEQLSDQYGMRLPKGASPAVIAAGKKLAEMFGPAVFREVAKLHFKTLDEIVGRAENGG